MRLSKQEMIDIRETILALEAEMHNPGAARARKFDIEDRTNDALYRITDAIERATD